MSLSYNYPLFDNLSDKISGIALNMPDAEVRFYPGFFDAAESDQFFGDLMNNIDWQQSSINTPRGRVPFPRLVAWYGDEDALYSYSGITYKPDPWTPALLVIKSRIEAVAKVEFNSVLLNLYRDGNDSVSWHSDDEPELGANPVIGSVSFGSARSFQFRHREQPDLRAAVELTHGSFLLMTGPTQHFWKHQIPKTKQTVGPRINLTFRVITHSPKSR